MVFSVVTELCNYPPLPNFRTFSLLEKEAHQQSLLMSPLPSYRWSLTYFASKDLPLPDISCKWIIQYMAFYIWLLSHNINVFKVYPCCSKYQCLIPFYWQITFYCTDLPYFTYYLFHLPVDGHLLISTFLLLRIMLPWTFMNMFWRGFFFHFYWASIYLEVELLSHTVTNQLTNCQTVFHSNCTILPPHQVVPELSTSSPTPVTVCFFYYNHPGGIKWYLLVVLIWHFPSSLWCWTSFHVFIVHL